MTKIVFLDRATLGTNIQLPSPAIAHQWYQYPGSSEQEALERLQGAQVAIVNKVPMTQTLLRQLPQLKLIAVAATGVNNVDLDYCQQQGIAVCNIQHYAKYTVAEHVLALILSLRRNLIQYRQAIQAGQWQKSSQFCLMQHPITDLHGQTLGIIGQGSIGNQLALLANALGMKVIFAARRGEKTPAANKTEFNTFLKQADIISIHCPLNADTINLIDTDELQQLKPTALLINTARGGIINETALANALTQGMLAGAGIDVLSQEPPTDDNPLLQLCKQPNLIITPHNAWASDQAMQILANQLIDNINAFYNGKPQNRVV